MHDRRKAELCQIGASFKSRGAQAGNGNLVRVGLLLLLHLGEAFAAVDRPVGLGLERDFRFTAAGSAGSREILPDTAAGGLAGVAADLAALRLIHKPALRVKLLLASREYELLSAFFARKIPVFVHFFYHL